MREELEKNRDYRWMTFAFKFIFTLLWTVIIIIYEHFTPWTALFGLTILFIAEEYREDLNGWAHKIVRKLRGKPALQVE